MDSKKIAHRVARAAAHAPGLKRMPVGKLLAAAEVAALAREHWGRLEPHERRRLLELVRIGRGRKGNLSETERAELSSLVAKTQPRVLAGQAADAISPVPLPRRLVYGRHAR